MFTFCTLMAIIIHIYIVLKPRKFGQALGRILEIEEKMGTS